MKKLETLILFLILIGGFIVRFYNFSSPVADWHSWRQSDTSAVSRNFIKFGFDILHPRFDDLSNGVSLIDNPNGHRFVEFPIYNVFQAGLFKFSAHWTLEEWGRIVTIFSSLTAVVFLYLLLKKHISARAGLIGAFFYAFVPYNIYFSRTILPDPLMIAFFLGGLFFFDQYLDGKSTGGKYTYYLLAIILTAAALLMKPFVVFFFLAYLYLIFMERGLAGFKRLDVWLFFIISIAPFILWRVWMQQYPEGIPQSNWLFNGTGIRFKGAWFWWIFAERIAREMLGFWGLPFVVLGMIAKTGKKEGWFFLTFAASSLAYLTVFATGNVQHDYYQILIVPALAIFFAKGIDWALSLASDRMQYLITLSVITVTTLFMLMFGWFVVRDFYSIQHPSIIEAGQAVDMLTPKDAKVIAPYNGDTTFLYFTKRQGWPVFERTLKEFKKAGASHIAFADPTKEELNFQTLFKPVAITATYAIFDLNKPTPQGLLEQKKN
ncbi:MAG: glycosyltransferase family 39 protein [Candidatus Levybacteria bacterium]|nr:glycosyltransferase family 39 protein [Candidatus Levybacteria bacterium]